MINYTALDTSGNAAYCNFNITLQQLASSNLNAGSSAGASVAALGGGVGGAGLLLILLVVLVVVMRRAHRKVLSPRCHGVLLFLDCVL